MDFGCTYFLTSLVLISKLNGKQFFTIKGTLMHMSQAGPKLAGCTKTIENLFA